jgi:transposase
VLKMKGEVLTGAERRRRWSSEEKAAIVGETLLAGAGVAEIARRHGISRSLLYTWRRASGQRSAKAGAASHLPDLVPVVIADGEGGRSVAAAKPAGTIEIALPGAVHVRLLGRIDERTLRVVLGALRSA